MPQQKGSITVTKETSVQTKIADKQDFTITAVDLFRQKKKEQTFMVTKLLPKSGIAVTYPNFIAHNESMAVMAKAGVTSSSTKKSAEGKRKLVAVAASVFCTFGPNNDRMSPTDVGELMEKEDTAWLATRLLGEDEDEEENEDLGKL